MMIDFSPTVSLALPAVRRLAPLALLLAATAHAQVSGSPIDPYQTDSGSSAQRSTSQRPVMTNDRTVAPESATVQDSASSYRPDEIRDTSDEPYTDRDRATRRS